MSTTATTRARVTTARATALAWSAAVIATIALIVAVIALQCSPTTAAAPPPPASSSCDEPIRVAANHGLTYAEDLATVATAVRLAHPAREVEIVPFYADAAPYDSISEADVVVNTVRNASPPTAPTPGAVNLQHPGQVWVQLTPFDDFSPSVEEIAGAVLLTVPGCEAEEVTRR